MANQFQISNEAASAQVNAHTALLNNGWVRFYDGTQPATADTAISGPVILAECRMAATAFAAAVNGVASANAITNDADANAAGTATWFRAFKSDGTSPVCQGSVSTSGADCSINDANISQHASVAITAWTMTQAKG